MVSAVSSRDVRTSLTSESSLRSLNRTGSSDLLRAENRRSVQARYNFQIDKNDLNENVDDIMKNFDVFSQFATQQIVSEDSIDVSGAGESFDGAATPTNSETPMDSRSLDDRYFWSISYKKSFHILDCSLKMEMYDTFISF